MTDSLVMRAVSDGGCRYCFSVMKAAPQSLGKEWFLTKMNAKNAKINVNGSFVCPGSDRQSYFSELREVRFQIVSISKVNNRHE